MEKFIVSGGKPLKGSIRVGGAKNVAMKVIIAGLLTDETLVIDNVPLISSVLGTAKIVEPLGVSVVRKNHKLEISARYLHYHRVPLELGGLYRTATMVIGPLLARFGKAIVPNPGGCRLGKRPVDWHMQALGQMGANIEYKAGYFHAKTKGLHGATIKFPKNSHTGTETIILAAVLARGETIIENAAEEPEVDDLVKLLCLMGAKITRQNRTIHIQGVQKMHGAAYEIMPDRNEAVTYAIAGIATKGDVIVAGAGRTHLKSFLNALDEADAGWEAINEKTTRFFWKNDLRATQITTLPHPGFMTDWQAPWAVLMTQAQGTSTIHETVYESRFSYVGELKKMGGKIDFYDPQVKNSHEYYNFNWNDRIKDYHQGIRIHGPHPLHEGIVEITDLQAGATLVVAALVAKGKSVVIGTEHIDRGYERFDEQLKKMGAAIKRVKEEL